METSQFGVLPLKFLMHFKDGATSYMRPVLMDDFYNFRKATQAYPKEGSHAETAELSL